MQDASHTKESHGSEEEDTWSESWKPSLLRPKHAACQ